MTKLKISDYLNPLDRFGSVGRVHSIFEHSFNIKIGSQLVNITNHSDYLSSFGIYLPNELFSQVITFISENSLVKIHADQLRFYSYQGIITVNLQAAVTSHLRVESGTVTETAALMLKNQLEALQLENQLGLMIEAETETFFAQMKQADEKETNATQLCEYFIGRGRGLTPSGDDILVAYLTMLRVLGSEGVVIDFKTALELSTRITTDVSAAYLDAALNGYVNSYVYDLLQNLEHQSVSQIETQIKKIMSIGHTSGKDMLFGMLLALEKQV